MSGQNLEHKFYDKRLNKFGYFAIETMLALALAGLIIYFSLQYGFSLLSLTTAENISQQAYSYSQAVVRYISTHQNLLRNLLSENDGNSNGKFATVSTKVLVDEGFIKNNLYFQNNLRQYPCTIIFYDNKQLQSYIYYRSDGNDIQLDKRQLNDGLNHMGAMMGIYHNGKVSGAAGEWGLNQKFTQDRFLKQGSADISQGVNPAAYVCNGMNIANNSYVVNVTSMLTLNNRLPKDDTIHQNQDQLHNVDNDQSNNQMNTDLIMDHIDKFGKETKSNVIFQMNPNCIMDPNDEKTMQDYDPGVDGEDSANKYNANSLGCKNRQLAITAQNDNGGNTTMLITGFRQGGYEISGNKGKDIRPYVGEIKAASIQPTALVAVGTACLKSEIGKMARQAKSTDESDVNNIYISQVICMQSPLCEADTKGICYMPLQSVTIRSQPNSPEFECPKGTFVDTDSVILTPAPQPKPCPAHDCLGQPFDCGYKDPRYQNTSDGMLKSDLLSGGLTQIYRRITVDNTLWISDCGEGTCHFGCRATGEGPDWPTSGTIAQIDCTNDPSKAAIVVLQN